MSKNETKSTLLNERLYWREQFQNYSSETSLPLDFRRPHHWGGKYEIFEQQLSEDALTRLSKLTQNNSLSILVVLTSAWSLLLHKYTGEADIVMATPAYSNEDKVRKNAVSLRLQIDSKETFKNLLFLVRSKIVNAFKNQMLEYEDFLTEIGLKRRRNGSTPFSNMISLTNFQESPNKNRYRSDLFVSFEASESFIGMKIEYNGDLFHLASIQYLFLHFDQLLSEALRHVDTPLESISCLTRTETELFEFQLNHLPHEHEYKTQCIHTAFESMAEQYPNKIAVERNDSRLTYRELNEKSNQVAHYLIDQYKVKCGDFVGFFGERSTEYVVAVLGILKAGCAFVPIDSTYPLKRILNVIEDSQIGIVLTTAISENTISDIAETGQKWATLKIELTGDFYHSPSSQKNPCVEMQSSELAYMIYTSGSTGKPKGAMIRHDGKMNHLISSQTALSLNTDSICLFSASISTDISIWQTFVALLCGGKTAIIDNQTLFDHKKIWAYIKEKKCM